MSKNIIKSFSESVKQQKEKFSYTNKVSLMNDDCLLNEQKQNKFYYDRAIETQKHVPASSLLGTMYVNKLVQDASYRLNVTNEEIKKRNLNI